MVDAPSKAQTKLHVITYLDWQREGQFTVDTQRAFLLDTLAQLLELLDTSADHITAVQNMILGSQTVLLNDTATVAPELLDALRSHLDQTNLTIGPWYVQLDSLLADGEAYIRSLLIGREDATKHQIPLNSVAFMPDSCQGVYQLPQILQGFGIDAVFLCMGNSKVPIPFNWQAPDGSHILVITYNKQDTPQNSIEYQRTSQPDGPFLWMHEAINHSSILPDVDNSDDALNLQFSTLRSFTQAVRDRLPDEFRPTLTGELYLEQDNRRTGRYSARLSHKQAITALQAKLNNVAEPLLALSLTFGKPRFPHIQKSLVDYSWRLLLQNMSRYTFSGAVSDDVEGEMLIRNRRIADNSQRVIDSALDGLDGQPFRSAKSTLPQTEVYLVVWNSHGHPVSQMVEMKLDLSDSKYPNILLDSEDAEQPFTWDSKTQIIEFRADAPSVGYAVYTLKISRDKTADYNQKRSVAGRSIGSVSGASLGLVGGRLDWVFENGNIIDLLNYHDGGDAGDVYQYREPQSDIVMKGSIVDVVQIEATPTYERLIYRNRMRIAPKLKDGKERVRGLRVLDLTTTATYYNGLPGIYFSTQFTNTAEDHRLRAHVRTSIGTDNLYVDTAFGVAKRSTTNGTNNQEQPLHNLVALADKQRGLGLFTRGLMSFEPIREDNQTTLALTLLRSVGWLDKNSQKAVSGAQMTGDFTTEFMLMPLDANLHTASLLRTGLSYRARLQAFQYETKPPEKTKSYLSIDNPNVVMTALKLPQSDSGLIVRLLNASDKGADVTVTANEGISTARTLTFAEDKIADVTLTNQQAKLHLEHGQVATLHLDN